MIVSAPDILNASILIVDDQESNVRLLEKLLSAAGYTCVASTMNPQEVCALHRKNPYDLILLDLQMPGMDGFKVMEALKTNDADGGVPVLVITAQPGHKLRALQAGAKDFVAKPFDLVEVKTRIHNMLEVRLLNKKLGNHNDVLEQTVRERTAELTATNRQLEAFVYSVAHHLRAPLRAMQGFSAMLVEEAGAALNATGKDYADRINKSAQFMDALLIDLLAFNRISEQRDELTSVNLETVVESVLSRLGKDVHEKNARVETSGPWPVVLAHAPTLTQVLFNLVSNALKFVTTDVPPRVRLQAEEQGAFIRVWVEDNGPGIASDHQAQIFRLFTRLNGEKYAGTGMGLAIVQTGIERMGGRAGVESVVGQGSRFWFELRKA